MKLSYMGLIVCLKKKLQFKKIHKKIYIYVYEIVKHNTNKIKIIILLVNFTRGKFIKILKKLFKLDKILSTSSRDKSL